MKNFPVGTNIFFSSPQSQGFNSAMLDILNSAEDIQKFIEHKMEHSSVESDGSNGEDSESQLQAQNGKKNRDPST